MAEEKGFEPPAAFGTFGFQVRFSAIILNYSLGHGTANGREYDRENFAFLRLNLLLGASFSFALNSCFEGRIQFTEVSSLCTFLVCISLSSDLRILDFLV